MSHKTRAPGPIRHCDAPGDLYRMLDEIKASDRWQLTCAPEVKRVGSRWIIRVKLLDCDDGEYRRVVAVAETRPHAVARVLAVWAAMREASCV